jgi:hypothetical protein
MSITLEFSSKVARQPTRRMKTIPYASAAVDCTLGGNDQAPTAGIADYTNNEMPDHHQISQIEAQSFQMDTLSARLFH